MTPIRSIAIAVAVVLGAPLPAVYAQPAAGSTEFCWTSLGPVEQDPPTAIAESQLAAAGASDIWLARRWNAPPLVRWTAGTWSAPQPARPGVDTWVEAVAASPTGNIAIAAASNRKDLSRELHIARLMNGRWQWLGAPLISSQQREIHAQRATIAFAGDHPVVAWLEIGGAEFGGLFVARWDGAAWRRLERLSTSSEDIFVTPAIAVDAKQQIWLAWSDDHEVRVVRSNGSTWVDVGRDSLKKISAAQGPTLLREISLAIGSNGHVWVLRMANTGTGGALALARWDGTSWSEVPGPRGPAGKDSTARSASMILSNDAPLVAWSQAGASDNHHLFVSAWSAGDRWIPRLSGLHLVEGISNVTDVRLASGDGRTLFISWEEPGEDRLSTRVIRAYACAAGETAAVPPPSTVERDTWPTTVDEAARRIAATLDEESRARVRATKKEDLGQYHHGWGMGIRNSLGLWRGNDKLLESCGNGTKVHPDSCSPLIIEAVWTLLQAPKL